MSARRKPSRVGWLRTLIREAEGTADDLWQLDRDMHEPADSYGCSFCSRRIALKRAASMARRQLLPLETAVMRYDFDRGR